MALKITKSTTLTGESKIGDVMVMSFSADINRESVGNTFVRLNITNQELYNANRVECRKDITAFQQEVFEVEDLLIENDKGASEK